MKKLFLTLYFCLLFIGANAAIYPLYVNGVQVTDNTKSDILGDGTMSFDPESMTLTLSGAKLTGTADGVPVIESKYDRMAETLKVILDGTVRSRVTTSFSADAFAADGYVTFTGDGNLYLYSKGGSGINMRGNSTTLEFDQTTVRADGDRGIYHSGGYGTLRTNGASVIGSSSHGYNTCGIVGFTWYDPENSKFDYDDVVFRNGAFYRGLDSYPLVSVQILPDVTEYPIVINGKAVNSANCKKFTCPGLNSGTATLYVSDDKYELVFNEVDITRTGAVRVIVVNNSTDATLNKPMVISFIGKNRIDMGSESLTGGSAIYLSNGVKATTIEGFSNGTLDITGTGTSRRGFYSCSAPMTMKDLTVNMTFDGTYCEAFGGGVTGSDGNLIKPSLTIDRSTVSLTAGTGANRSRVMTGIGEFTLTRAEITSHPGAYYDSEAGGFIDATGDHIIYASSAEPFVISKEKSYDLWLSGKEITSISYKDIPALLGTDRLTAGDITFDPETYTLTLSDAHIEVPDVAYGLAYYGKRELTVLTDKNSDETYSQIGANGRDISMEAVCAYGPIRFRGLGALVIYPKWWDTQTNVAQRGIRVYGSNDLTFDRCTVNVMNGIYQGSSSATSTVKFNSCDVWIWNSDDVVNGAVQGFSDVTLNGCITLPYDVDIDDLRSEDYPNYACTYDTDQRNFVDSSGNIVKSLSVRKTGLLGDANGDGNVDVTDVVAIANHVMGSTPANFVEANADINGQDGVDITDVVALANMVIGM